MQAGKCLKTTGGGPMQFRTPDILTVRLLLESCYPYPKIPADVTGNPASFHFPLFRAKHPAPVVDLVDGRRLWYGSQT
jgi:hypothetical protein